MTASPQSPAPGTTITSAPVPDLTHYDVLAGNLSGGKDSALMQAVLMDAARAAGVAERVLTFHANLGVLEWPAVTHAGVRWPSVAELAAQHSETSGVPAGRHVQVERSVADAVGELVPYSLLTHIAAYGRFPRLGTRYCTRSAKEQEISKAQTPLVNQLCPQLGRPVRILKVLGVRSDEGRDRAARIPYRNVLVNSRRHVDEWLPVKDWTTPEVKEWSDSMAVAHHWTYDSVPGANDWAGMSRCSCSLCVFASKRDLLLAVGRRPRLAALYAEVERVRRDSFRPDRTIQELIDLAAAPGAPDPGVVCDDDTPEFAALQDQVRTALHRPARKNPQLALLADPPSAAGCAGCSACP